MDVALNLLQSECSILEYKNAVEFLFLYIKNIHYNSDVEKYRKIRTGNEKFLFNVWRHEACRTLLLLTGFEEIGDFIILSDNADVSGLFLLLEKQMSLMDPTSDSVSHGNQQKLKGNSTLSLAAGDQGGGIFVQDMKADLTLLSYMIEMGYSQHAAEKGLIATKNQGVQPAMDWIAEHPEQQIISAKESMSNSCEMVLPSLSSSSTLQNTPEVAPITSRLRTSNELKHAYQEKLRLEAIKKAKLEKAEDKMAKKYLMKNLQSEREENKEKFAREKIIRHVEVDAHEKINKCDSSAPSDVNICVLRIRMPDGQTVMLNRDKGSSIKDLYSHVRSLLADTNEEFHVCIPHPHEILEPADEVSLQDKGLYPKATIAVQMLLKKKLPESQDGLISSLNEDTAMNLADEENTIVSDNIVIPDQSVVESMVSETEEPYLSSIETSRSVDES